MTAPDLSPLLPDAAARAIATRRDLHKHPELGLTEFRTASLVAQRLSELGLRVQLGREVMDSASRVGLPPEAELDRAYRRAEAEGAPAAFLPALAGGHTAVVGTLTGAAPGPVVALRVDMDALPILEDDTQAHLPAREGFGSIHPGLMHACAHDGHTAIGLAVAEVLSGVKDRLHGTVKFIFQPAEEGGRGALPMVKAGVVDDVDHFIAIHLGTGVPSRTFRPDVLGHLASAKLDVTFRGRAAHAGGNPDEGRNALLGAATAVLGLYGISRHHAGRSRVNVGTLRAGSGRNVIADEAVLQMEVRGETAEITDYMLKRAEAVLRGGFAGAGGGDAPRRPHHHRGFGCAPRGPGGGGNSEHAGRGGGCRPAPHRRQRGRDILHAPRAGARRPGDLCGDRFGPAFRPPYARLRYRRERHPLGDRGADERHPRTRPGQLKCQRKNLVRLPGGDLCTLEYSAVEHLRPQCRARPAYRSPQAFGWPTRGSEDDELHGMLQAAIAVAGCAMPPCGLPAPTSPHRTAWSSGRARELGMDSHRRMSMRSWPVLASSLNAVRPW